MLTLVGVLCFSIGEAYAMGSVYSDGRAFLRPGCPSGAGKVYVGKTSSDQTMATPASSNFKDCNSSTSPAMTQQVKGTETKTWYHFFAEAKTGYKFTGWYNPDDQKLTMTDASRNYYKSVIQSGTMALSGDLHAYLDCYAGFVKCIQMSFVRPQNGEFTVVNNGATVSGYASFTVDGIVTLTALPADGYKLRGWYTTTDGGVTKNYVAFGQTYEPKSFTSNVTIGAEFVPDDGKATFWIKGTNQLYDNLGDANTAAASSSSKTIVVVSDGVVGAGSYEISSGVTLLIPFKDTYDIMKAPRQIRVANSSATYMKTTTFRKLGIADGATINCYGAICICGTLASVGGNNYSSFPTGTVGLLDMSKGGTINMKSGSNLYAWGYVKGQDMDQGNNTSGCGQIKAESGSHIWEFFQVGDWRGGGDCMTIYNNASTWKYFPFQAWTMQNIEVPVTYNYGAQGHGYWSIFGNGEINTINFVAISNTGGAGVFQIASGGTVKKWYDPTTDRVCVELRGGSKMDAITLNVLGETVSTKDYNLPLPANIHLILANGASSAIQKPVVAHAGSVIEVQAGATLTLSSSLYLFDEEDWDAYCMNKYYAVYNSPSIHYDRGNGSSKTNLEAATIIADGAVSVTGNLYATAHGANIMGHNAGTVQYTKLPSNTTMTQCKERVKNVSVAVRSANLHNENDSYTKASVATFTNVNGRWFLNAKSTPKSNKTYDFTYIKSGDVYGTGGTNATVSACYSKDMTGLELRDKWVNVKGPDCGDWWEGIDDGHKYNYFEENAWHQFIKTSMTIGEEAEAMDVYSGTNGKLIVANFEECDMADFADIDGNCEYTIDGVKKVLVGNNFISVTKNSEDEAYHKSDAATTYYICFTGCVWKPATKVAGKEKAYTVESIPYIWYNGAWLAVTWDSSVSLYYSLDASGVKIYYEYVSGAWVLATPVAEVVTAAGSEMVYSMANAITKAKAGGTNVTIRLLKNLNMGTTTFSYNGQNNCGLDLNGFTLTISASSPIYVNHANAKVIIKDQSAAGTGKIMTKYNRTDGMIYGINVKLGCCVLNSGTVHIENTNTANSYGACGATMSEGQSLIINGGTLEAVSNFETRGIAHGVNTHVTINGGTVTATTSATVQCPYGIYSSGGTIDMNGGLVLGERTVDTGETNKKYAYGILLANGTCQLNMTGGEVKAKAPNRTYAIQVGTSASHTSATAVLTGGTATAETSSTHSALAVYTFGTTTLNGVTVKALTKSTSSYGVKVSAGTTTCNAGTKIESKATNTAYGFYVNGGTLNVKGGTIEATTTASNKAYGIYALTTGVVTTEGGEFKVTTKTTDAYAAYMTTDATGSCTLGGGKYMIKTSDGSSTANAYVNNTDAPTGKLVLAGGYYNLTPSNTYVQAGKTVKDLDATVEAALIAEGYIKKIAGQEYTVTWKNYDSSVLSTEKVESGKKPAWTAANPTYSTATTTWEFDGWCTAANNSGTYYSGDLPAVGATNVTYFAHYKKVYAEVTVGTTTTRYYDSPITAWKAAIANPQAVIRALSDVDDLASSFSLPATGVTTPENAIITLDLNGHKWTVTGTSDVYAIRAGKAGCKLIITDNSVSGDGYIMHQRSYAGNLLGAYATNGELILQGGAIKSDNLIAANNTYGVYVDASGMFTMMGGTVDATKSLAESAGVAVGVYISSAATGRADLTAGTVKARHDYNNAFGLRSSSTGTGLITTGEDLNVEVNCKTLGYAVHSEQSDITINGGTFAVTTTANKTYGIRCEHGSVYVNGEPEFTITGTSDVNAVAAFYSGDSVVVNGGHFIVNGNSDVNGVKTTAYGKVIVNDGTFDVTALTGNNAYGVYAVTNGIAAVTGGTFNVSLASASASSAECLYVNGSVCDVTGGDFVVKRNNARYGDVLQARGGATVNISGTASFWSSWGIKGGTGKAHVTVNGGKFDCSSWAFRTESAEANRISIDVWDGKFLTGFVSDYTNSNTFADSLRINGGYYKTNMTNGSPSYDLESAGYVKSPAEVVTLVEGVDEPYYTEGYRFRVKTKYKATWTDGSTTLQTNYWVRNETPVFEGTPVHSGTDTYEFIGWVPTPGPITANTTYVAQFKKYEAELIEGEATTGIRFEHFDDAFEMAKTKPISTIKVLSDLSISTIHVLDSAVFTRLDLNNHVITYTGTSNRAFEVNREEMEWVVTDNSVAKGGRIDVVKEYGYALRNTQITKGSMRLEGGELRTTNSAASKTVQSILLQDGSFTMTGGTIRSMAATGASSIYVEGGTDAATVDFSGGSLIANACTVSGTDTTWTADAKGIYATKGSIHVSGTASILAQAASTAYGVCINNAAATTNIEGGSITTRTRSGANSRAVQIASSTGNRISGGTFYSETTASGAQNAMAIYLTSSGELTVTGGSFTSKAYATASMCVYVTSNSTLKISDGTFHATTATANSDNVDIMRVYTGCTVDITGGTFTASNTTKSRGIRAAGGTTSISGNTIVKSKNQAILVADHWAGGSADQTARVNVNGGTFISEGSYVIETKTSTSGDYTCQSEVVVNGGYIWGANANEVVHKSAGSLVLHGGYYNETSGTKHRNNIKNYIDESKTAIADLSPKKTIIVDETTYTFDYELLTNFTITWKAGTTTLKEEELQSGVMPSYELTSFVRNDSTFYNPSWTPTLVPVAGDATYQAVGDYYEAKVKIGSGDWTYYSDFLEAWDVVKANANCTIALLNNVTLTSEITYIPDEENSRAVFDLNNFKLSGSGGSLTRLLILNRADAQLTITDNSEGGNGTISLTNSVEVNMYTVMISQGELVMAGGKVYVENERANTVWHLVSAICLQGMKDASLTVTGGTVQAEGKYTVHAITAYNTVDISGGTIIANATGNGDARGLNVVRGTSTISGNPEFRITTTTNARAVSVAGWISADGKTIAPGIVTIDGGTYSVTASSANATAILVAASGTSKYINGTAYTTHGTLTVNSGTFSLRGTHDNASALHGLLVERHRLFNEEVTPHVMLTSASGEMIINGGTFTVEARNTSGNLCGGSGNMEMVRSWGTMTINNGTFTLNANPAENGYMQGIRVFSETTTVNGGTFNFTGSQNLNGIVAADYMQKSYGDANIAHNIATAIVNGGVFYFTTTASGSANCRVQAGYVGNSCSTDVTGGAGYAAEGHLTISGGEFHITGNGNMYASAVTVKPQATASGDGFSTVTTPHATITGGKFMVTGGQYIGNFPGNPATSQLDLQGGFYNTDTQLDAYSTNLPTPYNKRALEDGEPEKLEGYNYEVCESYTLTWTTDGDPLTGTYTTGLTKPGTTIVAPETPTKTAYVFAGWTPAVAETMPSANTEYTATWTAAVASVKVGSTITYYAGLPEAFAYAKTQDNSTIKLLQNTTTTVRLNYDPTTANTCTLDLNGKTVTNSNQQIMLYLDGNSSNCLTITDSGTGGTLNHQFSYAGNTYVVGINQGKLILSGGTLHDENTYSDAGTVATANGVNVGTDNSSFEMTGGRIEAVKAAGNSGNQAIGVSAYAPVDISGGTIVATSAASNAFGVQCSRSGKTYTIRGTVTIQTQVATGTTHTVRVAAGTCNVTGGTFTATQTSSATSYGNVEGVRVYGGTCNISGGTFTVTNNSAGVSTAARQYASSAGLALNISGGTFTADQGVYMDGTNTATVEITGGTFNNTAHNFIQQNTSCTPTISGGKFITSGQYVYAVNTGCALPITGGYFNEYSGTTHKTQIENKTPDPKHPIAMTDAECTTVGMPSGSYKVVDAYTLTWNLDGGSISSAGTPAGYVAVGATVTAPTVTKTGYTFKAWSPTVVSPMPASDKTYTATWTVNTYKIDPIGVTPTGYGSVSPTSVTGIPYNAAITKSGNTITVNGTTVTATPAAATAQYTYTFKQWNNVPSTMPANNVTNITAEFTRTVNKYTILWKTEDGATTLETDANQSYGAATAYNGSTPTKAATAQYTYTFDGWTTGPNGTGTKYANGSTPTVSGAATYYAHFSATVNNYTVTVSRNNTSYGTVSAASVADVPYGSAITVNGNKFTVNGTTITATPTANTAQYTYTFSSWTNAPGTVNGNLTVTANFTRTTRSYIVSFNMNGHGTAPANQTIDYGSKVTKPSDPTASGYTFGGWYKEAACTNAWNFSTDVVTGATTLWAKWTLSDTGFWLDIIDANNSSHTLTINTTAWPTDGWPYTIGGTSYTQPASGTLTIPYTGNPGDDVQIVVNDKTSTTVSQHTYTVPKEVTTATTLTANQLMNIFVNGTTLTVNANITVKNVYVGADAKIVINSGKTLTADGVYLRTTVTSSAELELNGTISGQVYYTRIISDKSGYHQFGLPFGCEVGDVVLSNGTVPGYKTSSGWVLRQYNEDTRAEKGPNGPNGTGNWTSVPNGTIVGGKGYNMYSGVKYYREFYFPVTLPSTMPTSVSVNYSSIGELQDRGWNVLVSPLTKTYVNNPKPEGMVISWLEEAGGTIQEQPYIIPPATVFVYQASKAGSISFAGSKIVVNEPRRIKAEEEETRIQWLHLDIEDANGVGDQTSVYSHPTRYEQTYKTGIDVAKQSLEASHAVIYSLQPYGEMAFAGVADAVLEQGVPVTVYSPSEQKLTISMRDNDWLNRLEKVYLLDNETGMRTDLLIADYSFDAKAGTTEGRFILQGVFKAPQGTTDIDPTTNDKRPTTQKLIIRDKMYILVNDQLYDATGKQVKK